MVELFDASSTNMELKIDVDHLNQWKQQKDSSVPIHLEPQFNGRKKELEKEKVEERIETMNDETAKIDNVDDVEIENVDDVDQEHASADEDFDLPTLKKRIDVLTDVVVQNLDREKVSNRGSVG